MNINIKNYDPAKYGVLKFLEGGAVPPESAPADGAQGAPAGGEDPMQQVIMACLQALQSQDCNLAMQVCQALMQMAGGGAEAAPEAQGEPVYRAGGRLVRRISK